MRAERRHQLPLAALEAVDIDDGLAEIGGLPALTAALAILSGIVAAIVGEPILRRMGIEDWRAHGLAAGLSGSGVAAAQVAKRDPLAAAFSALGIGLNGLLTSLLVPLLVHCCTRFLS